MGMKSDKLVYASFDGVAAGKFKTFAGGEVVWANGGSVSGAGEVDRARVGRKTIGNITIGREDDGRLDLKALSQRRTVSATVTVVPPDDDGNPMMAQAKTYTGKVIRIGEGEADAESETDLDAFEIEIRCNGVRS
ncbi:MAG: hypothetical protein WKF48_05755 [Solirubrobacteraceae bacterium]